MSIISRETLADWLNALAQEQTLIAPKKVNDILLYRPVHSSAEIVWNYIRPVMSIKEAFFPPTERLLSIEKNGQSIRLSEIRPEGEQVLFGVRPCDARSLLALDALFIDTEPIDSYYAQRRQNTTIIGMACTQMSETCFCTSTGGSPDDYTGMDVIVYPLDGGYQVRVLTPAGERIAQSLDIRYFELGMQPPPPEPLSFSSAYQIPEKETWPAQFDDSFWAEMAERCLSCRICAYVCPTCRCFDVRDEPVHTGNGQNQFERIRCWDSCTGAVYRRIAGGHNPRAAKGERLRNRFFCKFYYYPEQYGPTACTGCGRCIEACPVNIDITEVIQHLQEVSA
jgi:sulfhydrogenase subunit beta (sulfur reductase)